MKRSNIKSVKSNILVVNRDVNFRIDYDLPSMVEDIRSAGRVLEPVWVRKEDNVVLKGNRRVSAVQQMLKDPTLPSNLKENIESLDVIYVEDLTPAELTEIVLDHGSQKPLSRAEVVLAVWRLQKEMRSEREIITVMFHLLARFTGNTRKAYEAQSMPSGPGREAFLSKWLHGTVGAYLMPAGQMGQLVRDQMVLTETANDRELTKAETELHKFKTSRERIGKLTTAKKNDKNSDQGWDVDKGGPEFNALIEKFIAEDAGSAPADPKKPSHKQMEETGDSMKSRLRLAYKHCAGTLEEGKKSEIDQLDTDLFRFERVQNVARTNMDRIKADATFTGLEIQALLGFFLKGTEAEFETFLKRFQG